MSLKSELDAIRGTAAFAILADHAFLRITGPDAKRWLNGMVTNSVQSLRNGEGCYSFLLNAQGRIQGDCTLYCDDTSYLLETDRNQLGNLQQMLDRFIIMDDVELTLAFDDETSLLILGPQAPSIMEKLGLEAPKPLHLVHAKVEDDSLLLLTPPPASVPMFQIRSSASAIAALQSAITATEVSQETLEAFRILESRPRYGADIRDRDLPQETAQSHALHFDKGCYLGQEIVERINSRGQIHRRFTPFTLSGQMPELPETLEANGKPSGELTSAVQIGETIYALGYARREALDTKAVFTYAGGTATPRHP